MVTQLIYCIIALLLFTIQEPGTLARYSPASTFLLAAAVFLAYCGLCKLAFLRLERDMVRYGSAGHIAVRYRKAETRLAMFALVALSIYTYVLNIKYYLRALPGFEQSLTFSGLFGLGLYLLHLTVVWLAGYSVHHHIYHVRTGRFGYVLSNLRFYAALLIPWLLISLLADLLQLIPESQHWSFLTTDAGQLLLFGVLLCGFLLFSPWLVVRLWRCTPLPRSSIRDELEGFCSKYRFKLANFLFWPIFAGDTLSAAIMGILPRLRYILITPSLLALLNLDELRAVVAHEMGHIRRYHIPFYLMLFLGYSFLAYSLDGVMTLLLLKLDFMLDWALSPESGELTLFSIATSLPAILLLLLYFRYLFGFFMRNSERQADLYAMGVIGHPFTLISSLQKIAIHSGHIEDLPSWHHYSIRQRIQFLLRCQDNPALIRKHDRKLYGAAALFLLLVLALAGAGFQFNKTPLAKTWQSDVQLRIIEHHLQAEPEDANLYAVYGGLLLERGDVRNAEHILQKLLVLRPDDPRGLNNLAWLYATSPPPFYRPEAALTLALKAAALEPDSAVLDTLAEAYYANGRYVEALESIQEAIRKQPPNMQYLLQQKQKFQNALSDTGRSSGDR